MPSVSLTRLELKRNRERLVRYERFLPALKLRQQQLQVTLQKTESALRDGGVKLAEAATKLDRYAAVLGDVAGLDVRRMAEPAEVRARTVNVAGVQVPELDEVVFNPVEYSLFATPPWVEPALDDLRALNRRRAEVELLEQRRDLLRKELTRVVQRVNLFEKVKIPETQQIIQRIRIHLGDQMAAAVGRSKIAKAALSAAAERSDGGVA